MPSLTPCPPWLLSTGTQLLGRANAGQLAHALLFKGVNGIGKIAFSRWLAESLLCRSLTPQGACGSCESCQQILADSHPDLTSLTPEGANQIIKIDAVRQLVDWLQLTSGQSRYRIAVIENADRLNRNAANSLLKTLEEPSDNALLILCADKAGVLPATIRSRCQKVTLVVDKPAIAHRWLSEQALPDDVSWNPGGQGPFSILRNANEEFIDEQTRLLKAWSDLLLNKGSVGKLSDSVSDIATTRCLALMCQWCVLSMKARHSIPVISSEPIKQVIQETQHCLKNEEWVTVYDRLLQLYRSDSASFKTQTVLEGIFADVRHMSHGSN